MAEAVHIPRDLLGGQYHERELAGIFRRLLGRIQLLEVEDWPTIYAAGCAVPVSEEEARIIERVLARRAEVRAWSDRRRLDEGVSG